VVGEQPVAPDVVGGRPGMVLPGERRCGGSSTQPLDLGRHLVPVATDYRDVEHGDVDRARVAADVYAVSAERRDLRVDGGQLGWQVAGVGQPGRDAECAPLTRPTDDDRYAADRPWVAGGLG
jgi:hypothetical protein